MKIVDFPSGTVTIPVIVQDTVSGKVLTLAEMNEMAFQQSQREGLLTLYNKENQKVFLYHNLEHQHFTIDDLIANELHTTLLAIGHFNTGATKITDFAGQPENQALFLDYLKKIIRQRKNQPADKPSYTKTLFEAGINKIAQKVGEEAVELVIEAKDDDDDLFKGEAADLLFHYLVLLEAKNIDLDEIIEVLKFRHQL